jgi:hypothetical protein
VERLVINTLGGLITREVPLKGEPDHDIETVAAVAAQIVTSGRNVTAEPTRKLGRMAGAKTATKA